MRWSRRLSRRLILCFQSDEEMYVQYKCRFTLKKLRPVFLLGMLVVISACSRTTLEDQFRGMESCNIKNIFLDPVTGKVSGNYFSERKLEPCRVDEAAFYCVEDSFYGLPVSKIAIPYRGPFSVHAFYLKGSLDDVQTALRAQFKGIKFNEEDGISPSLIADPDSQTDSIFYCDEYSE